MRFIAKIFLGIMGTLFFPHLIIAQVQVPIIEWQKATGGGQTDYLGDVKQRPTGGYYAGGTSYSNISGNKTVSNKGGADYWVVRLNNSGGIVWQRSFGGSGDDFLSSVQPTSDGGCILAGSSLSEASGDKTELSFGFEDYWVIKLDSLGTVQWQNTIGANQPDILTSVKQCYDGGYILAGVSESGVYGDKSENSLGGYDFWVVKLGVLGNVQWENTIGGTNDESILFPSKLSVDITSDGGFILLGSSNSNASGDKTENSFGGYDYWVVKLNGAGNIQWQNTIGGNDDDYSYSVQQTLDGKYILSGTSYSGISGEKSEPSQGDTDYWIIKLNDSGNIFWQNTIGGTGNDDMPVIRETQDEGYILGGTTYSGISGDKTVPRYGFDNDFWILRLDNSGNILWQKELGGSAEEVLSWIHQTSDLGYIIGGSSFSDISFDKNEASYGDHDYWIVKLCPVEIKLSYDDTSMCEDADPIILAATSDSGFFSGPGVNNNVFYPSIAGVGTHLILYTNVSRCFMDTMFKTMTIHVLPNIIFPAIGTICIDSDPIDLNVATPVGGTYEGTGIILNIFDPSLAGMGKHEVTYAFADSNGCKDIDTNFIIVAPIPKPELGSDTSIWFCEGDQFELKSKQVDNYKYLWNTGDTTFSILVEKEGTYSLRVTDTAGCSASDTIWISEGCNGLIFIPNSFSPNGDGLNDLFLPKGSNFSLVQISIFNRWGEEIFKTTDKAGSWNGMHKNQVCPEGVYVYALDYTFFDIPKVHRKTGTVTLLK